MIEVKSYRRKVKGKTILVKGYIRKGNHRKVEGAGKELEERRESRLPVISRNSLYEHPDWELIPNKPNRHHGGTGAEMWDKYERRLKDALKMNPIKEVKDRIHKELKKCSQRKNRAK